MLATHWTILSPIKGERGVIRLKSEPWPDSGLGHNYLSKETRKQMLGFFLFKGVVFSCSQLPLTED